MKVLKTSDELQLVTSKLKETKRVGFVPTMGALHDGHAALVKECAENSDITIASIFVNPTQFNDKDDFHNYPRTLVEDKHLLKTAGCDLLFFPETAEIYGDEVGFDYDFKGLDARFEGEHRPGHFLGVVRVVKRLFELVQPHAAFFGKKDFQQLMIIRQMTEVFEFDVEIVSCDTVRESSGLAMSSRNKRLSDQEKNESIVLHKSLSFCKNNWAQLTPRELFAKVASDIGATMELEYFSFADAKTLKEINNWGDAEHVVALTAAKIGEVRLIDNMEIF